MVINLNCVYLTFFGMKCFLLIILKADNFVLKIALIWKRNIVHYMFKREMKLNIKMLFIQEVQLWQNDDKNLKLRLETLTFAKYHKHLRFGWLSLRAVIACFQLPMKMTLHIWRYKLYSSDCSILKTLSNYSFYQCEHLEVL